MPLKEDGSSASEDELIEDLEDMEVGQSASNIPAEESKTEGQVAPGDETPKSPDESDDEEEEEEEEEVEHPKIGKTLYLLGVLLCIAGLIGVVGLRTNVIQHILGDPSPYPGIGYVEPWGHIVSMIPFVLGFITMLAWGIKNDPIYYENQKRKEEEKEEEEDLRLVPMPSTSVERHEKFSEPLEDLEEAPQPKATAPIEKHPVPVAKPAEPKLAPPKPTPTPPASPDKDQQRTSRCEKMLAIANILPEDRERLKLLIPSGINPHDFTEEVKKAIDKKKKKDAERKLSANEKAAMLEKELAAELAELENALDKKDDNETEEKILKEIEDLENL